MSVRSFLVLCLVEGMSSKYLSFKAAHFFMDQMVTYDMKSVVCL